MTDDRIPAIALGLMMTGAAAIAVGPPLVRLFGNAASSANPEQWLGFLGSLVGAVATLLAAGIALFAAYQTISPVKRQLAELVKQNEHIAYDKLRNRATDLNDERILISKVVVGAQGIDDEIKAFMNGASPRSKAVEIGIAIDSYAKAVTKLENSRGNVWGDKDTQERRDSFSDACMECGRAATAFHEKAANPHQSISITIKPELAAWRTQFPAVEKEARRVSEIIASEIKRTRISIGELERRLFP